MPTTLYRKKKYMEKEDIAASQRSTHTNKRTNEHIQKAFPKKWIITFEIAVESYPHHFLHSHNITHNIIIHGMAWYSKYILVVVYTAADTHRELSCLCCLVFFFFFYNVYVVYVGKAKVILNLILSSIFQKPIAVCCTQHTPEKKQKQKQQQQNSSL